MVRPQRTVKKVEVFQAYEPGSKHAPTFQRVERSKKKQKDIKKMEEKKEMRNARRREKTKKIRAAKDNENVAENVQEGNSKDKADSEITTGEAVCVNNNGRKKKNTHIGT